MPRAQLVLRAGLAVGLICLGGDQGVAQMDGGAMPEGCVDDMGMPCDLLECVDDMGMPYECPPPESLDPETPGSAAGAVIQVQSFDSTCPFPAVKNGKKCELNQDWIITNSLSLSSSTHLNCKGHKILPSRGGSFATSAGSGSIGSAGITVTGSGTNFTGELHVGSAITALGQPRMVVAVTSATSVTVNAPFNPALPAGTTFVAHTITQSIPRAAFVLDQAFDAKIQNCVVGEGGGRFDYGVIAVRNQGAQGVKILGNAITSVRSAVTFIDSDGNTVADNTLRIQTAGAAVYVLRDSDGSKIVNNQITLDGYGAPQVINSFVPPGDKLIQDHELVPGSFRGFIPNQRTTLHVQVEIGRQSQTGGATLINFRLGDRLLQFPLTMNSAGNAANEQPDGNLIEGNTLGRGLTTYGTQPNLRDEGGSGNVFRGNSVGRGWMGIGFIEATAGVFPGQCMGSARYCLTNADCTQLEPNPPGGDCLGVMVSALDERAGDAVVENNTFIGPYTCPVAPQAMAILAAKNVRVVGNIVDFNGAPNGAFDPGLWISARSIAAGVISRNVFTGNSLGLRLSTALPADAAFGLKLSLNDFAGNSKNAIDDNRANPRFLPGPLFPLAAELSFEGRGNYWGRTCEDSDGFYDFDELNKCTHDSRVDCTVGGDAVCNLLVPGSTCILETDSPTSSITDSHPYGQPVAGTPDGLLPAPCK